MKLFGIIGKSLSHSFSPDYFNAKFQKLNLPDRYEKFELSSIAQFPDLIKRQKLLRGLNVTIPYKSDVIPFLNENDDVAKAIGAVNTVVINDGRTHGFNTDVIGFNQTLKSLGIRNGKALVLGSGGVSKAVQYVLKNRSISFEVVSRNDNSNLRYEDVDRKLIQNSSLIINCTPKGMWPNTSDVPDIPHQSLTPNHILIDLIYTPRVTTFLQQGLKRGCRVKNGYEMLISQAEASWRIWNE